MKPRWLLPLGNRLRRENWRLLGLLLATFAILALGISGAVKGLEFGLLWPPMFVGLALGWGLAASSISGGVAALISLLTGPFLIMIQIGNLLEPAVGLLIASFDAVRLLLFPQAEPAIASLEEAWMELAGAASALFSRLYAWLLALGRGEPTFDPVATAILWLLVLWGAAVWAAWSVRRRNQPLRGLLPILLLSATLLAVTGGSSLFLVPALALSLILKAFAARFSRERNWRAKEIEYSRRSGRNAAWTASGLALALMMVALITPSPSIYRLLNYARDLAQPQRGQEFADSLGLEAAPSGPEIDVFAQERLGGLPARHLIGSGPELSEEPVMAITIEGPASLTSQLAYWRGLTYDHYTGHGWETGGTTTIPYEAGETAGRMREKQHLVRQEVVPLTDLGGLLYAAGTLTTVDQTFQVAWRARFLDSETYTDFFAAAVAGGETDPYRADSLVPFFDEAELRAIEGDYPDWIAEKYLTLPEDVSDRVRALARDLTAVEPTPYDRALAIEGHLRQFPYTLDLPAPPADREIADYFLFELQRGYCDYYATTMVVLARAAGLPARLATGYIGGSYDPESSRYTVTADLAHSWPEIYFPEYGWIPFEPTAGRPAIERPIEVQPQIEPETETEMEPITAARSRTRWNRALGLAGGILLLVIVVSLGWWLFAIWRLHFLSPDRAIAGLYEQMNRSGRHLDVRPGLGETPHEFAGRLGARLTGLSGRGNRVISLASAPEAIDWFTTLYTRCLFSPYEPGEKQRTKAIRIWWRLRFQLLWATLLLRSRKRQ